MTTKSTTSFGRLLWKAIFRRSWPCLAHFDALVYFTSSLMLKVASNAWNGLFLGVDGRVVVFCCLVEGLKILAMTIPKCFEIKFKIEIPLVIGFRPGHTPKHVLAEQQEWHIAHV